jgi:hypothetical protein
MLDRERNHQDAEDRLAAKMEFYRRRSRIPREFLDRVKRGRQTQGDDL